MAIDKLITMKQFNGTDYDTLYPKTIAAQIPDVFSKSETVNAETLSQYGLGASGTPNDVFGVLSRFQNGLGNEYVWEKTHTENKENYTTQDKTNYTLISPQYAGTQSTIAYADSFSVSDGAFVLNNPSTLSPNSANYQQDSTYAPIKGKYIRPSFWSQTGILYIPTDAVFSYNSGVVVTKAVSYSNPSIVTTVVLDGYVNSPNPSAYPPAVSDGYVYRELGQIAKKLNVYNIREITTEAQASTVEIDISDLDLNEWEFLVAELVPSSGNGMGTWWAKGTGLSINDMYYLGMGDLNSTAGLGPVSDFSRNKLHTYMVLMLHKNKAQNMKALTFGSGMYYGRSSNYTFEPITSLVIASTSEDYYLNAGTKIYLWGVK